MIEYLLRLYFIPKIGLVRRAKLVKIFPDIRELFESPISVIKSKIPFLSENFIKYVRNYNCYQLVKKQIKEIEKNNIGVISYYSKDYPEKLKNIPLSPIILFFKGKFPDFSKTVAIIGSRKPIHYSRVMTEVITRKLVKDYNLPVISGLAYGIDAYAHKVCIENKGIAVGILAFGFDTFYPRSNEKLAQNILENGGCLITEYPFYYSITKNNFIERNRIIAALCDVLIIIQAAKKSGTLKTAYFANEYGKDICVVPYRIDSPLFKGSHYLIQQGAYLLDDTSLIGELLNMKDVKEDKTVKNLTETEKIIVSLIKEGKNTYEELLEFCDFDFATLSEIIVNLEIKGIISSDFSGNFILK